MTEYDYPPEQGGGTTGEAGEAPIASQPLALRAISPGGRLSGAYQSERTNPGAQRGVSTA